MESWKPPVHHLDPEGAAVGRVRSGRERVYRRLNSLIDQALAGHRSSLGDAPVEVAGTRLTLPQEWSKRSS